MVPAALLFLNHLAHYSLSAMRVVFGCWFTGVPLPKAVHRVRPSHSGTDNDAFFPHQMNGIACTYAIRIRHAIICFGRYLLTNVFKRSSVSVSHFDKSLIFLLRTSTLRFLYFVRHYVRLMGQCVGVTIDHRLLHKLALSDRQPGGWKIGRWQSLTLLFCGTTLTWQECGLHFARHNSWPVCGWCTTACRLPRISSYLNRTLVAYSGEKGKKNEESGEECGTCGCW